jgi:hypothetical protein
MANDNDLAAKYGRILKEADQPTREAAARLAEMNKSAEAAKRAEVIRDVGDQAKEAGRELRQAGVSPMKSVGFEERGVGETPGHSAKNLIAEYRAGAPGQAAERAKATESRDNSLADKYGGPAPTQEKERGPEKTPEPEKDR